MTTTTTVTTTATTPTTAATTTAAADRGARPDPGVDAAGPEERIAGDRDRIDDLDRRIIELIRERVEVSARIQRTRIEAGGRRVNLSREMEVLTHYRERLGRPGTSLAMTLLELCRGRV
ncbi:chorismate mutase [Streptomyces sp. TRM43335]|uniref:Chorismate mutase n=1 Tax=Streptomyces taklimakanensis TaxID=2569853 RepID=A0A6G2BEB7_9ACTN|nr:chorismate mutase [Streptomyces taklimakanensis]MTE20625.1 chorismate mutase [Streptomyces taklimakanensis]